MKKSAVFIASAAAAVFATISYVSLMETGSSKALVLQEDVSDISGDTELNAQTKNEQHTTLSEDASYPTPVKQLQQTLAYGLVNADAPSLPLLQGDIEQFAQSNISEDHTLPNELTELKSRLNKLKQLSQ
ncbi:hypothetical protein [Enterovibrio norvegicus]|uniref:hypothetical protein n=1 Tax=Enterovibrio norvegicus TaxID=188144 RepID=UPI0024B042DC|nr:hypothetical protein [Enterovibrio norvegicus]